MTVPRKCSQRNWNIPILALICIHPYSTVVFGPIHTNTKPFSLTLVYTYFGCCGSAHSTKGIQPEGDTDLQVHTVRASLSHAMYFSKTLSLRLLQTWNKYPCGFQEVRITFILLSSKCIKNWIGLVIACKSDAFIECSCLILSLEIISLHILLNKEKRKHTSHWPWVKWESKTRGGARCQQRQKDLLASKQNNLTGKKHGSEISYMFINCIASQWEELIA